MGHLRRTVLVSLVWLTAAMTLVAGSPHFDCLCPNGHHKPFCLGSLLWTASCCCRGVSPAAAPTPSCCRQVHGPVRQTSGSCCCHRAQRRQLANASAPVGHIEGPCCQKTLTQAEYLPTSPSEPTARDGFVGKHIDLAPALFLLTALPPVPDARLSWLSYDLPPPTDLVTTLQRLTI
jgi:hypothetical protein